MYTRGLLVFVVVLLIGYLIHTVLEYHDGLVIEPHYYCITLLAIILLPLPREWLHQRFVCARLARKRSGRASARMGDKLVEELSLDSRRVYPVALINFPSQEVRSMGLVTSSIAGDAPGSEYAVVYLPKGPGHAIMGYLRSVNVEDLEYTETVKILQQKTLTGQL